MPSFLDLIGQHPILCALAANVSTVDLLHLALTCHDNYAAILSSRQVFETLRRESLCDGSGLKRRKNGTGLFGWRRPYSKRKIRVYATIKCDAANTLPCLKCDINICEECRYYPREKSDEPDSRPHLNGAYQLENVMCLCVPCDEKLKAKIKDQFPVDLCDCDQYKRWICHRCKVEENDFTSDYMKHHTYGVYIGSAGYEPLEGDPRYGLESKVMGDHQHDRTMFCSCGAAVPDGTVPRCTWCLRAHRPEAEWGDEMRELDAEWYGDLQEPET